MKLMVAVRFGGQPSQRDGDLLPDRDVRQLRLRHEKAQLQLVGRQQADHALARARGLARRGRTRPRCVPPPAPSPAGATAATRHRRGRPCAPPPAFPPRRSCRCAPAAAPSARRASYSAMLPRSARIWDFASSSSSSPMMLPLTIFSRRCSRGTESASDACALSSWAWMMARSSGRSPFCRSVRSDSACASSAAAWSRAACSASFSSVNKGWPACTWSPRSTSSATMRPASSGAT